MAVDGSCSSLGRREVITASGPLALHPRRVWHLGHLDRGSPRLWRRTLVPRGPSPERSQGELRKLRVRSFLSIHPSIHLSCLSILSIDLFIFVNCMPYTLKSCAHKQWYGHIAASANQTALTDCDMGIHESYILKPVCLVRISARLCVCRFDLSSNK